MAVTVADRLPAVARTSGPRSEVVVVDPMMIEVRRFGDVDLQRHVPFGLAADAIMIESVFLSRRNPNPFVPAVFAVDDGAIGDPLVASRQLPDFSAGFSISEAQTADRDVIATQLEPGVAVEYDPAGRLRTNNDGR